jgi:hypothetical protein
MVHFDKDVNVDIHHGDTETAPVVAGVLVPNNASNLPLHVVAQGWNKLFQYMTRFPGSLQVACTRRLKRKRPIFGMSDVMALWMLKSFHCQKRLLAIRQNCTTINCK